MQLKSIDAFTTDEEDGEQITVPETITVQMSQSEVVAVASLFGKLNGHGRQKLGLQPNDDVYGCLVGDVINRYWENGTAHFGLQYDLPTLNDPPL